MSDFKTTIEDKYRHIAKMPDRMMAFTIPIRKMAVGLLNLKHGASVIDVGCGSGASFKYLVEAVGEKGSVTGIDISPSMIREANKRIEANRWRNVSIVETSVEEYASKRSFDGALLFAMQDVFTSESAIRRIFSILKPGTRIVCVGPKLVEDFPRRMLNPLIALLFKRFAISQEDRDRPWRVTERYFKTIEIIEKMNGFLFIYFGEKR